MFYQSDKDLQIEFKLKAFLRYFFGYSLDSDCPYWLKGKICGLSYKERAPCSGYYNCVRLKIIER